MRFDDSEVGHAVKTFFIIFQKDSLNKETFFLSIPKCWFSNRCPVGFCGLGLLEFSLVTLTGISLAPDVFMNFKIAL